MSMVVKGVVVVASLTMLKSKYKRRFSPGSVIISGSIQNKVVMGRAWSNFSSHLDGSFPSTSAHSMSIGIPLARSIKQTNSERAPICSRLRDDAECLGSVSSIDLVKIFPAPSLVSLFFCPVLSSMTFQGCWILSTTYRSAVTLPSTTDVPSPQLELITNSSRSELSGLAEKATPATTESTISITTTAKSILLLPRLPPC
mmetsp:Transcript_7262/g.14905  ORF Transcript_7262/g.14905 Transcript_7262/m.14905 type:complete len:200 (+) Transcript_7262:2191-2790(+)